MSYLAEPSEDKKRLQPTFSPHGDKIVYTEVDIKDPANHSVIIKDVSSGEVMLEVKPEFPPFYFCWSPDGSWLTFLSIAMNANLRRLFSLQVIDISEEIAMKPKDKSVRPKFIRNGQPFFYAFHPSSGHIAMHTDLTDVNIVDLLSQFYDEETRPLKMIDDKSACGFFSNPIYTKEGELIMFSRTEGQHRSQNRLALFDTTNGSLKHVFAVMSDTRDHCNMMLSADNQMLSYVHGRSQLGLYVVDRRELPLSGLQSLPHRVLCNMLRQMGSQPDTSLSVEVLAKAVLVLREQLQAEISSGNSVTRAPIDMPALTCFWSPDSSKLLYLRIGQRLQWCVWSRDTYQVTELAYFTPSVSFAQEYLPYIDQYYLSQTLWSPHSSAFVYPAEEGVFMQAVPKSGPAPPPQRIGEGDLAFWSPQ